MKTLTILRHAKSGWDAPVERDFDRPINARGRRGAELIGQYVRRNTWPIDRIIASPAVRVTDTLDVFLPAAGLDDLEPHWDRRIYLASAATLMDVIREAARDADHLMLVGHNPGLEDLILMLALADKDDPLRSAVDEKLPTAALARLDLAIDGWRAIKVGVGKMTHFVRPRDLDPELGPQMD